MIAERFGTFRGLVRLGLAHIQVAGGQAGIVAPDTAQVKRLVFVCHGNICRSAFADVVAAKHGLRSASFGLSTSAGQPAHAPAAEASLALGHDLSAHRTTKVEDFESAPGDYLLGMEVRHLQKLAALPALPPLPRSLLGLWAEPRFPHLHDPYQLDPRYMATCLARIEGAVAALSKAFPAAKL
jgi:protein-tyrosine phosphatase